MIRSPRPLRSSRPALSVRIYYRGLSENSNPRSMSENESGISIEILSLAFYILTHLGYNRAALFGAFEFSDRPYRRQASTTIF